MDGPVRSLFERDKAAAAAAESSAKPQMHMRSELLLLTCSPLKSTKFVVSFGFWTLFAQV